MTATDTDTNPRRTPGDAPAHEIRFSSGTWAYSTGDDGWPRGIYQGGSEGGWRLIARLPYVTERLTDRDGDGRLTNVRYRLTATPGGSGVIVEPRDILDGTWAIRLDVPLSADKRIRDVAASAILDGVAYHHDVAARESVADWVGGELATPPVDVGPVGYLQCADDEARALDAWREIATIARKSPKLLLAMGASLGGLYSKALRRQIHLFEFTGDARQGKSTALMLGAAIHGWPGDPKVMDGVMTAVNSSAQGVPQRLASLGVYPAFLDELGSAKKSPAQREEWIFGIAQGSKRQMGGQSGPGSSYRTAGYHGTVFVSGNESLTSGVANEGVWARVISIATPITMPSPELSGEDAATDAATDAQRLAELAPLAYGWPLTTLMRNGMDVDGMRSLVAWAENTLPLPPGGIPETVGQHLALAVAGAHRLSDLIGEDVVTGALQCAREVLHDLMTEIEERGLTPADRLMAAIKEALATRPRQFPPMETYRAFVREQPLPGSEFPPMLPSTIDGFIPEDGQVAILRGRIKAIAAEAGIDDPMPGLKGLRRDGRLVTTEEGRRHGRLAVQRRIRPKPASMTDVYLVRVSDDDQEHAEGAPGVSESAPPQSATPVWSGGGGTQFQAPGTQGGTQGERSSDSATAFPENQGVPCTDDPGNAGGNAGNAVFTQQDRVRARGTQHDAPGNAVLALSATPDGFLTYDGRPIDAGDAFADMAAFLGRVLDLMPDGGTVAISVDLAKALGMGSKPWVVPETGSRRKAKPAPPCVEAAAEQGWKPGSRGVLSSTTWVLSGTQSAVTVVVPAWTEQTKDALTVSGVQLVDDDTEPFIAAFRFGRWRELVGTPWVMTAGTSAVNLTRRILRSQRSRVELKSACRLTREPQEVALQWQAAEGSLTALSPDAAALGYVHAYDARAAYLAAMSMADVPRSSLQHTGERPIDKAYPGYWLIPEADYRLPCGVPVLTNTGDGRHVWVTTPIAMLLIELDLIDHFAAVDSWTVPDHEMTTKAGTPRTVRDGGRVLKPVAEAIRDALLEIPATTQDPDEVAVRTALKASFHELIGQFRTSGGLITRGDWADLVIGTANANLLRRVHQAWEATGAVPVRLNTDAVYYATAEPDAETFRPAAFPEDPRHADGGFTLGRFKVDTSLPAAEYMEGDH